MTLIYLVIIVVMTQKEVESNFYGLFRKTNDDVDDKEERFSLTLDFMKEIISIYLSTITLSAHFD